MTQLFTFLGVLWFFLPAGVANMAPIFAAKWNWFPALNRPLDGGLEWGGRPLLGENKTWRGLFVGVVAGGIVGGLQYVLFMSLPMFRVISIVEYDSLWLTILLGAWLGFGALLGDAAESFAKRLRGVPPGKPWRPWDQIDLVLGAFAVSFWLIPLSAWWYVGLAVVVIGFASYVVSRIGVRLRIKQAL